MYFFYFEILGTDTGLIQWFLLSVHLQSMLFYYSYFISYIIILQSMLHYDNTDHVFRLESVSSEEYKSYC